MTAKLLLIAVLLSAIARIAAATGPDVAPAPTPAPTEVLVHASLFMEDTHDAVHYSAPRVRISILLSPKGAALPAGTELCVMQHEGAAVCNSSNDVLVRGLITGTHLLSLYLSSGSAGLRSMVVVLLLDTVEDAYVQTFLQTDPLAPYLDHVLVMYGHGRSLRSLLPPLSVEDMRGGSRREGGDRGRGEGVDRDRREGEDRAEGGGLRIGLFMHNISLLSLPSFRLNDWISSREIFESLGHSLVIITGTDSLAVGDGEVGVTGAVGEIEVEVETVGGIPVLRFDFLDALAEQDSIPYSISQSIALQLLSLDALVLTNTYADRRSTLLLSILATMSVRPLVLLDLPNVGVGDGWAAVVDAFIAPSRAVAFHHRSAQFGKPIAVIYPPMRDQAVVLSPCLSLHRHTGTAADANARADAGADAGTDAETRADADAGAYTEADAGAGAESLSWPRAEASDPEGTFTFLYVGRLAAVKCPGILVRAVAHILHSGIGSSLLSADELNDFRRRVRVNFVGGGVLEDGLRHLARRLQLDMVSFKGALGAEEVAGAMRGADVLVNPRITGETFGYVHIEAAAQALPVIAFNTGANRESVLSGLLVEYRNGTVVEDLAAAMVRVYRQRTMPMFSVEDMCVAAVPMFERWSTHRHSLALIQTIRLLRLSQ